MPANQSLHEVFVHELRDMYDAEQQVTRALPKLIDAAASPDLRDALERHLTETRTQIDRLDRAFEMLDEPAKAAPCPGMTGIIKEGEKLLARTPSSPIRDAALIGAAQRVEHYETAVYGTLVAWASVMGHDEVASLLKQNLEEEKHADQKLSELAEGGINSAAQSVAPEMPVSGSRSRSGARRSGNGRTGTNAP